MTAFAPTDAARSRTCFSTLWSLGKPERSASISPRVRKAMRGSVVSSLTASGRTLESGAPSDVFEAVKDVETQPNADPIVKTANALTRRAECFIKDPRVVQAR